MKRIHTFLPPVLYFAVVFCCDAVFSQTITWQQTNGPEGGTVLTVAINSHDHIFVGTDQGGIFRSTDNGQSWHYVGLAGLGLFSMAINVQDHIFVGTDWFGVGRSTDNGETWTLSDKGLTNPTVGSLATNSQGHIFAGTGTYWGSIPGSGIFRSIDNGDSWTPVSPNLADVMIPSFVAGSEGELFAGTLGKGVYRSSNNGDTWIQKGLDSADVISLLIHPNGYVFAGTTERTPDKRDVFRSEDHGETWTNTHVGSPGYGMWDLAVNFRGEVFVAHRGVSRSSDYGGSWKQINTGLTNLHIEAIAINSQGHVFAVYNGGVARSTDNGEHWEENITGLIATRIRSIAFNSIGCVFASGGTSAGVSRSCDLGESWTSLGFRDRVMESVAVNSMGHIFVASQGPNGGVFRSKDNGRSWNINGDLMNFHILSLAINSKGHIFAGSGSQTDPSVPNQGKIFRSMDDGESWVELNTDAIHKNVHLLIANPNDDLFAATATFPEAGVWGPDDGLFRSTDNGETWVKLNTASTAIQGITIDQPNGHIFIVLGGHGILRSVDNGDSWQVYNNTAPYGNIGPMVVSNGNLFAGLAEVGPGLGGVLWFNDDGATWTKINTGLTNLNMGFLDISPSGFLFAGTTSTGVFRSVEPINFVSPPAASALAFPSNNAVNQPTTLTLYWNPYVSVETYHLQLATSSDFVSPVVDDSTVTTASREIGPLENNTAYYWRVQAKYAGGTSPWSEPWSFKTIIGLPNQVALLSPPNAAAIGANMVDFKWRQSAPVVTGYWFELATDSSMTNAQIDSNLTAMDTTKTMQVLSNPQTYWWRVRAKNLAGWGPFSEQRKFQVIIAISPSNVEFGEVLAGETATQDVTITNTGTANLNVTSISLVGESANNFSVDTTPFTLAPNGSKTLEVSFSPTTDGRVNAELLITIGLGESRIGLTGTGILATFTKITTGSIVSDGGQSTGGSWVDFDNDNDLDLFVANGPELYRNNGNGTFTEVTTGAIDRGGFTSSWGDYDNDGDLDAFVANRNAPRDNNFLYVNNGDGTFTRITEGVIIIETGNSIGCTWGDYDNDGYLDLFVANSGGPEAQKNSLFRNNGDGTFTKITTGDIANDMATSRSAAWGDYDNDGDLDLFVANEDVDNDFYRNNSNGTFTKITDGPVVNDGINSWNGSWGDCDNDGDLDLFVTNLGGEGNNLLYQNNGDGTFGQITESVIVNDGSNSMGSSWGDYDNDGDLDLFVARINNANNSLYQNNGDGTFIKITMGAIVNDGGESHTCSWGDYDNDGDLDLFVGNADFSNPRGQDSFLYRNNGNNNHWINIKCVGTVSNTSAIGAKVRVKATIKGRPGWQLNEISSQTGFGGQNSLNAEFGLGNATVIDSLKIEWPSGIVHFFTNLQTNQFIEIREDSTLTDVAEPLPDIPTEYALAQNYPNPFNPSTQIAFSIPRSGYTTLKVYNILGREIAVLMAKKLEAGRYKVNWNRNGLPSGVYFYRLQSSDFVATKKMILLR